MSLIDLYNSREPEAAAPYHDLAVSRSDVIGRIDARRHHDVLVIGGGIHGAMFARVCALHGLKTVLLERNDYASGTSSRSSRMAHGGLRYLEMLDFKQVVEGVQAREDLGRVAPHLVHRCDFAIPLLPAQGWRRVKLGAGLWIYDYFLFDRSRRHRWLRAPELPDALRSYRGGAAVGAYCYTDSQMNDTRLVLENIIAARQEGALCLNYASVESANQSEAGPCGVGWVDRLTSRHHELTAGIVVNCAGAWAPSAGRLRAGPLLGKVRYSRGIHLVFRQPWIGPAVMRYADDSRGHYFIWPHPAGTLVGPTDTPADEPEDDPLPTRAEVDGLLARLAEDFPAAGLNRGSLSYCYAGIRTLPLRKAQAGDTSKLSRRHIWSYSGGMLTLLGGKFTTAAWTVDEGFAQLARLARLDQEPVSIKGRVLPGGAFYAETAAEFRARAAAAGVPERLAERAVTRLGSLTRYFGGDDSALECMADSVLQGEIKLALEIEQAECLEDLMRRRLELEVEPGHGLAALDDVAAILAAKRTGIDVLAEKQTYIERMERIRALIS